jgi:DNA-binding HxlR family transcriptional regulator
MKLPHPKSERLVLSLLSDGVARSPAVIARTTSLSQVTVDNVLAYLAHYGRVDRVRQGASP